MARRRPGSSAARVRSAVGASTRPGSSAAREWGTGFIASSSGAGAPALRLDPCRGAPGSGLAVRGLARAGCPGRARPAGEPALGEELEAQGAGHGRGLNELDLHLVPEPVGLAGAVPDECVSRLIVAIEIRPDRGGRDEAVGARLSELHEETGLGDAGDLTLEDGADLV